MKSAEIREKFIQFFQSHGHQKVRSSSLIPAADPTLLFTNAGMVQFKDCFLGLQDPGYKRATTCQKCVRAGGKHNDLENVGFTARHHTFFEMLGNFSFGDYFKKEAIAFAWELVTKHYQIPPDKLRVTVFEKDDEAFEIWKKQGIKPEWIGRLGEKDNFWAMGDTGPCGPSSEIFYDWGEKTGCGKPDCAPGCDCVRFLEIWNLVFMQFNREASGKLTPLPKPSVDTGAGLERVAAVLQGVFSNYDTDVFKPIFAAIEKVTGKTYGKDEDTSVSMRVIADHIRACTFLLADGVLPSNEGRGYVLRRILRRAIRHGKKLGKDTPFMYELVETVVKQFGGIYPEVAEQQKNISAMMKEEEERFHETLHRGMGLLETTIQALQKEKKTVLPGDITFRLYDTFGFPFDLIAVIAQENGLSVDESGFKENMEKQRSLSNWKGEQKAVDLAKHFSGKKIETEFVGYTELTADADLVFLAGEDGEPVTELTAGKSGYVVFSRTPFYAVSGGQVGDRGKISQKNTENEGEVLETSKIGKTFIHHLKVTRGSLKAGKFFLAVDADKRKLTAINHTATHLLHAALRQVLGDRVKQAGSLVNEGGLRFDYTFNRSLTKEEIAEIEARVKHQVNQGAPVEKMEMSYDEALKTGALAFFDDKYGDQVRVIRVGGEDTPFSVEFCGGTHLDSLAEVRSFKIVSESSVASGVRRIEAFTADRVEHYYEQTISERDEKIASLEKDKKALQKENEALKLKVAQAGASAAGSGGALHERAVEVKEKNLKLVAESIPSVNPKILRTLVDQIRDKLKERVIVVLATEADGKVALCVGLTKDLLGEYDAGKLIQPLAKAVGGTGGGRPDFAQAGGTNVAAIPEALAQFKGSLTQ